MQLPKLSTAMKTPKLCVNCKHFRNELWWLPGGTEYGKCQLFPREKDVDRYLVDGTATSDDYWYCSILRSNEKRCGIEARYFEAKTQP